MTGYTERATHAPTATDFPNKWSKSAYKGSAYNLWEVSGDTARWSGVDAPAIADLDALDALAGAALTHTYGSLILR